MNNFAFSIPTRIQFGKDSRYQAGPICKGLVAGKPGATPSVLMVVDPGIRNAPWLQEVIDSINRAQLHISQFSQVKPNPHDEDVYEAAGQIQKENASVVIAIGGGSTIDTAKGAALIAGHGGKVQDYAGWGLVPGPILPVMVMPTTSGSGSEVTSWAVITNTSSHIKLAIGDRHLSPAAAIVDPVVTTTLPAGLTATTGMDVLTHSIEAYICALSNPINDLMALESIRLVAGNLLKAFHQGQDLEARQAMALASLLGGIAINNADVAGVHCLTEGMGSLYDAPHGLLNAIFLPYFMSFWMDSCKEKYSQIARIFGGTGKPEEAVQYVLALNHSLNIPLLSSLGVKQSDLSPLARLAEANVSNPSNPIQMRSRDYLNILEQALFGQPPRV